MGRKMSEETKRKISRANKGRKMTAEQRRKQSEARKRGFAEGRIKIDKKAIAALVKWNKEHSGERSPSWKGGRSFDQNGYVILRRPDHPNSDSNGQIPEHRLVMSEHIGRPLQPWEHVHHINAVKTDNRIENLLIVTKKIHKGYVTCPHCNQKFAIR
jgi:hypothetical protein